MGGASDGRRQGIYLATVLEGEPEGEVAAALCVLGIGENDGALGGPVQSRTDTANCGPEYDEPSGKEELLETHIAAREGQKTTYSVP